MNQSACAKSFNLWISSVTLRPISLRYLEFHDRTMHLMLQNISFSNKCCTFNLYDNQTILKNKMHHDFHIQKEPFIKIALFHNIPVSAVFLII